MSLRTLSFAILFSAIAGVSVKADDSDAKHQHAPELNRAVCVLTPTKDNKVRGRIFFTQGEDGATKIHGVVNNLTPGMHGFHIHEFGDLTDRTGKSAGGHFNPEGHDHAGPDADKRHVGDLGNIEADDKGVARVEMTVKGLKVHFILGRSIVVHAGKDDLKSQPSGNAGPRVAVGVIGIRQPMAAQKNK